MCLSHPHTLPALQGTPAQHAITTATQQLCSARTPCQCLHGRVGPLNVCRRSPLRASQTKSSPLPPPPLASRVPSGLQALKERQITCAGYLGRLLAKEGSLAVARAFVLIYVPYWLCGLSVPA